VAAQRNGAPLPPMAKRLCGTRDRAENSAAHNARNNAVGLFAGNEKLQWIIKSGWKGLCPRCGKGHMFKRWLKVVDTCEVCGLDYGFAAPDDGPAFFSLCIVAFPLTFVVVWIQVAYDPPWWVHLFTSLPLMVVGCLGCLHPIKGWLVASQYVNKAVESGTEGLWAKLNARERAERGD
jgi:uncharacterized protein (DUF983 family)